jgi:hypothetical protein
MYNDVIRIAAKLACQKPRSHTIDSISYLMNMLLDPV